MYIEEVIIDGFKSYAQRTIISNWDPEFNAITGLNGTGKSNILDAICFALGIQSVQSLRATNLQELIYKKGQAAVQKASVTLVFDNGDRSKSPIGYEDNKKLSVCRQIMVGGKNKYFINSAVATQQKVASLFQSVQLNVNNPHFLIMQGKITKVLNMKPPEILAMIEEAAGTRMFEDRKQKALDTIKKKDAKLLTITETLEEEITPRLNKLREQKRTFLEFKKIESELEHLSHFLLAYDYNTLEEKLAKFEKSKYEKTQVIQELEVDVKILAKEILDLDNKISDIATAKNKNGSKFVELETIFKNASKDLVKIKTQYDLKCQTINEETESRNELLASKKEAEESILEIQEKQQKLASEFENSKMDFESKTLQVKKQEELLQTLTTGISASEGHENGYMDQLQEAKRQAGEYSSEIEQIKLKISHLEKDLAEVSPKARKAEKENSNLISELDKAKKEASYLQDQLSKMSYDPKVEENLIKERDLQETIVSDIQHRHEQLERQVSPYLFSYSDPVQNFDRTKVKGIIAELIEIPPKSNDSVTALEVCAGSRLYNVVVESEVVGGQLLTKGRLKKRVTIIPLNKVSAFKVKAEKIATAKNVAPGKANIALSLIGYDEEVAVAMQYVFGSTLICSDPDSAKKVTFHPEVRLRSVTLEGDVYDPSGSLSGGSKTTSGGVLMKILNLKQIQQQIHEKQATLDETNASINALLKDKQAMNKIKGQLDLKTHAIKLLSEQMSLNSSARVIQQFENLKSEIEGQRALLVEFTEKVKHAKSEEKRIEGEIKELSMGRDGKLKSLKKELGTLKANLAKMTPAIKENQCQLDILNEEIVQAKKTVLSIDEQIGLVDRGIEAIKTEQSELQQNMNELKVTFDAAEFNLEQERKALSIFDVQVREFETLRKTKKNTIQESEIQCKRLAGEIKNFEKERSDGLLKLKDMNRSHPWIKDQKQFFGKEGGDYDFSKVDIPDCKERQGKLKESFSSMRKNVKTDVLQDIEKSEKKEKELNSNLSTVKKDKKKIEDTIISLDEYKLEALSKTWTKVNRDFGDIFGELLPGNTAKLEPPENQDITQGLEVKVCLGKVWKHSLTELSGGQRSLIALSLIMSLLQFKPAPMYILDEIDAALDLSHTQNIGQLFRNRFKGSQFIVVSLKEGMFTNANVLFKSKFRDGVSAVDRIVQNGKGTSSVKTGNKPMGPPSTITMNSRRMSVISVGSSRR